MKAPRVLSSSFILLLLAGVILWGCTAGQKSPPSQNSLSPVAQTDEASGYEIDGSVGDGTESPVGIGEVSPVPDAKEIGTIRIFVADKVTTLEPYQMVSIHPDNSVASHLWDTLTLLNDNLQVEPHVAESWHLVNNFTWEFKLRQGITFHNGELLNAEAVRFSIKRAQSMPGSLETFAKDVGLEQVEVVDDYTVRFTTLQPVVNMPYHLAFLEILPPIYYSKTNPNQLTVAPIGSGPYQLSKEGWIQGQPLVLEAAPDYWQGASAVSRLVFQTVPSVDERLAALLVGEAILVTDLPPMPVAEWNSPNSRLEAIESTQRMLVGIRIEEGSPLADKRVRQALNYGVNVEQIVDDWLEDYGERYGSWVNSPSNNSDFSPWPYDPDLAHKLLAEAGYSEGITITLRTPVDVYYHDVDIATTIAQQLGQIGITVEVETVSNWNIYVRELLADDTACLFLLGFNSRGDVLEDTKNLSATFIFNPTGWRNENFEDTLKRAINTYNDNSRTRYLNEAQEIAYEEAPWIWLWKQYDFYGISQSLDWSPRRDGLVYIYKPAITPVESAE